MSPRDAVGRTRPWSDWFRHMVLGCESFIEEDGEVINGLWWGFCDYCGCRHAKKVAEGQPVGSWKPT